MDLSIPVYLHPLHLCDPSCAPQRRAACKTGFARFYQGGTCCPCSFHFPSVSSSLLFSFLEERSSLIFRHTKRVRILSGYEVRGECVIEKGLILLPSKVGYSLKGSSIDSPKVQWQLSDQRFKVTSNHVCKGLIMSTSWWKLMRTFPNHQFDDQNPMKCIPHPLN